MKSHHNEESLFLMPLIFVLGSTVLLPVKAQDDLVYVAVEPCRIVDTREAGGAIPADTSRNFRVSGTIEELAVQGGKSDCLDPKAGTGLKPLAISAYVIAVPATSSTSGGVLTAYPTNTLPPPVGAGSTVNFAAEQIIGNTTNITLCEGEVQGFPCPASGEFAILARSTDEHVVIDVQGYFYPQQEPSEGHIDGTDGSPQTSFSSRGAWTSDRAGVGLYTISVPDLLEPTATGCSLKTTAPNPVVSVWNTGAVTTASAFINGVGFNCVTLEWTFFVKTVIDGAAADSDFTFHFY